MKKRNKLFLVAFAILLACSVIVLTSSATDKSKPIPSTCCKKIEKKCTETSPRNSSGELIMDNLSRQFISIFSFTR